MNSFSKKKKKKKKKKNCVYEFQFLNYVCYTKCRFVNSLSNFLFFDKNMNYSFIWKEIHQRKQTTTGRKTTNNNTPLSSMYPRAHKYSCACILKFWTFFSWSLATFYKFPIIGHKGILVGSFLGEGLLVGFRLGDLWAPKKDI